VLLLTLMLFAMFVIPLATAPNIDGPNFKNVTVITKVNITNAKPEVLSVNVYPDTSISNISNRNVTINAGLTKTVYCNATVRDWNGFNDIIMANATLWNMQNTTFNSTVINNNSYYINSTCYLNASTGTFTGHYACGFDVYYYANNGTWNCTFQVMDNFNKSGSGANTTFFYPLYALNVTDGIDYGSMAVEETSQDFTANITNLGNRDINITVQSYARFIGDGLAMNCTIQGNISAENQRFGTAAGMAYTSKTPVNGTSPTSIGNLTVGKQTVAGSPVINTTYWQLYIPPNPAGNCSGFIIFTATTSINP